MKNLILALIVFTTVETLDMSDLTVTTDNTESGTQQRIFIVMSNGSSLFDDFEDSLKD